MSDKKISIITTTYQDVRHLKKVVEGIKNQDYPRLEYIIVDGGSTDGTVEYLKELEKDFSYGWPEREVKWISEKDNGIYDALNKGIRMATGDIIGTMFDKFSNPHVLSDMVSVMEKEGTDGVHGDLYYVDELDNPVREWKMGNTKTIRDGWMPAHPTLYLKKEVYDKFGVYKTDYRIAADYEFMIRILKDNQVRLSYIPEVLVHMFYGGTSSGGLKNYILSFQEGKRALEENQMKGAFFITVKRTLIVLMQFVKAKLG
ncbi:MAG: glycosyltransferase [Lachnospiraceae bacterium]|nr:glycosyltransferase [Lachnospiraceae bacterium]